MTYPLFKRTRSFQRLAVLAGLGVLAIIAINIVQQGQAVQRSAANRVVEVGASYLLIPDLHTLTEGSDLVVAGRVLTAGTTRLIAQPTPQPQGQAASAPAADVPAEKRDLAKTLPASTPTTDQTAGGSQGVPVTDYSFQVTRVLHGAASVGSTLTVTQPGGEVTSPTYPGGPTLHRTLVFEHDPLLQQGEEAVLFLRKVGTGGYAIVGGPQGRASIANGHVHPIDVGAVALRAHDGKILDDLAAAVNAGQPQHPAPSSPSPSASPSPRPAP